MKFNILQPPPYRGRSRSNSTKKSNLAPWPHWKEINMGNNIATPPPFFLLDRCKKQKQNTDYSGNTWVSGKAEPISPRVAASLGEPMLGWTRRGVPFWEVNRSDGTMAPSWRDPDLLPRVAIALTVGKVQPRLHFPATKNLY